MEIKNLRNHKGEIVQKFYVPENKKDVEILKAKIKSGELTCLGPAQGYGISKKKET